MALVTGATRGLGLEASRQLATRGYRVLMTGRTEPEGIEGARKLTADGFVADFQPLDVTDIRSVNALASHLKNHGHKLDALVNNAGVSLHGFDEAIARRTLEVNFFGPMHVTDL